MKRVFKIGDLVSWEGLYGGSFGGKVIARTETTVTILESWIAEDSGKECFNEEIREISEDEYGERFKIWEYRGDTGYVYARNKADHLVDEGYTTFWYKDISEEAYNRMVSALEAKIAEALLGGEIEEADVEKIRNAYN